LVLDFDQVKEFLGLGFRGRDEVGVEVAEGVAGVEVRVGDAEAGEFEEAFGKLRVH
jgi:hypothetical protein